MSTLKMEFKNKLLLDVSRESWKMSSVHGTEFDIAYSKKYKKVWDFVWERDGFKCYFCNFYSKKYQEIHHLDHNHGNNDPLNLATVCPLCHKSFHLDSVSNSNGGKIIWLPEMSQQEFNYILRSIFIANDYAKEVEEMEAVTDFEDNDKKTNSFYKVAKLLESFFLERADFVERNVSQGASDPASFANALLNIEDKTVSKEEYLHPFKLLHFSTRFSVQTKYWREVTFKDLPVKSWGNLILNFKDS
jgi:intracellular multiplication protein IcmJ